MNINLQKIDGQNWAEITVPREDGGSDIYWGTLNQWHAVNEDYKLLTHEESITTLSRLLLVASARMAHEQVFTKSGRAAASKKNSSKQK